MILLQFAVTLIILKVLGIVLIIIVHQINKIARKELVVIMSEQHVVVVELLVVEDEVTEQME